MPRAAALLPVMTAALMFGSAMRAHAQAPDGPPAISLGAVVFYDYTFAVSPETADAAGQPIHANSFNVARTYLNVTGRVNPIVSFRITPDITRTSGSGGSTDGSLTFRLKYGFAQFDLSQFTGDWTGTWIRAGIQQTPFIDGEEGVYRYRFQGTLFAERDGGLSSADAGVSAHANLPGGYGDVHVGVYNGEGYQRAEVNDQKALMVRATVRPVPAADSVLNGLRLTAYIHRDHYLRHAERHRLIGSAWFEHSRFNAGFDYLTRDDRPSPDASLVESHGWSAFVTPFLERKGDGLEVLARYDSMRPNTNAPLRRDRAITGVAYWMPQAGGGRITSALMLDLEQVFYRHDPADRAADRRVILHGLINF